MTRVYIGRLGGDCRERDLERFFKGFGRIRDIVIKDGFAFVEFDDYRDADDAVRDLDGRDFNGNRVRVEHSRPRGGGGGGGRFGGYGGGGYGGGGYGGGGGFGGRPRVSRFGAPHRTKYQVRVENLSTRSSWQDLKDFMRQAGNVTYAEAHKDKQNEGIVCFETEKDMQKAMEKLNGADLNGRNLVIQEDKANARPDRGGRFSRSRSRSRSGGRRERSESRSRSRSKGSRSKSRSRSSSGKRSRSPSK